MPDNTQRVFQHCNVFILVEMETEELLPTEEGLVLVGSTWRNLRSLALAVAAGRHVLLEGAVGCGKTALVEHLAAAVGRTGPPQVIKVQLGDQTDSKVSQKLIQVILLHN